VFQPDDTSTVKWTPDQVTLTRYPATCGAVPPPFDDLDLYDLDLYQTSDAPGTSVNVTFVRTDVVGRDYALTLTAPLPEVPDQEVGITSVNTTTEPNGDVNFHYQQGQPAIAPLPLAAVTVRFSALPREDGDELVADTRIEFADGNVLAFTARPTLPSVTRNPCPQF
jgi:hypothetical protein